MAERNRSVLEDDEIDRVRPQPPARVGEQREPLLPAGVGAESLAKRHGEIDVVGQWTIREHGAIVMRAGIGRSEKQPSPR